MRAVLCGFGRAGTECLLQWLADGRFGRESLFVCTHEHPQNAGFLELLKHLKIPYTTASVNACLSDLKGFGPELLFSVYYRHIIKPPVLELVKGRAVNLHPSLLPAYKGCFSSAWAILNGEATTGITYHYMTPEVDAGAVLLQDEVPIAADDTAFSLYHKLISRFILHFPEALERVLDGDPGTAQRGEPEGSYYPRQVPHGGQLVCGDVSVEYARRFVRALYFPPYPPARFLTPDGVTDVADPAELEALRGYFGANEYAC